MRLRLIMRKHRRLLSWLRYPLVRDHLYRRSRRRECDLSSGCILLLKLLLLIGIRVLRNRNDLDVLVVRLVRPYRRRMLPSRGRRWSPLPFLRRRRPQRSRRRALISSTALIRSTTSWTERGDGKRMPRMRSFRDGLRLPLL